MKDSSKTRSRGVSALFQILNYNFCPSFDRYVYWIKQPVGWVVGAAIASLMIGLFVGPQGFVLMWSMIVLLAIGIVWPLVSIRAVSCELTFEEESASEGIGTIATLQVKNSWPIPVYGLTVEGSFLQEIKEQDDAIAIGLEKVSGWSVTTFKWTLIPQKRGQLPAAAPILSTGFPFGIIKCSKVLPVQNQILVWPGSSQLNGKPSTFSAQLDAEELARAKPGKDGEMTGVRDFRRGDSIRQVHWAKTAQNNRLIVKEFESSSKEWADITVDLSKSSHLGSGGQSSFEWAIRTAATICKQLDHHQFLIKLNCIGLSGDDLSSVTNETGVNQILDFLAILPEFENIPAIQNNSSDAGFRAGKCNARLKFLVCTDRSKISVRRSQSIKRIQIACNLFQDPLSESNCAGGNPAIESPIGQQPLTLTSPKTAAAELADGWSSEYSYGI